MKSTRIEFNFNTTIQFDVLKSILNNLFKNYLNYSFEEIEEKFESYKNIISLKKIQIIETFFKLYDIRGDYCDYQQLLCNFQSNEIHFSTTEFNIIVLMLYQNSKNLFHMNFTLLFNENDIKDEDN